ncbi:hypothetical protein ACQJBY_056160 [Aegilops geniculata]
MDIATGAIRLVLPKLAKLATDEFKLLAEARGDIAFLQSELEPMKAFLIKVAEVPADELDQQVKIWSRDVRELSYDIEDKIDDFTVRVDRGLTPTEARGFKEFIRWSKNSVATAWARRRIAKEMKGIKKDVVEVAQRHERYKLGDAVSSYRLGDDVSRPSRVSVDPRMLALYQETAQLVGVEAPRDDIARMLGASGRQLNVISIVGFGGLGKTALAKVVYDMSRGYYECYAFVSVSLKPDMKKMLRELLRKVSKLQYAHIESWDERQLIDELREFLQDKRYFIIIDDIWDISAWEIIKYSLIDNKCASRVILTTRKVDVAEFAGDVYRLKPLSDGNSKNLFHRRIFGCESKCPPELQTVSRNILSKCGGLPLAIITIASLLANKPITEEHWYSLHNAIGRGIDDNSKMHDMRRILSLSYFDLPTELQTCLLYLSMFPEDREIAKDSLIWKWEAEGFIQEKQGQSLQDVGETYFNELVNRSFIQAVGEDEGIAGQIKACRLHDIVLEFLISIATEENFVTNFDGLQNGFLPNKVRRLSLQNSNKEHTKNTYSEGAMSLYSMRSFTLFGHGNFIPPLVRFRVLRVLDLEGCTFLESHHLKDIESLYHLRYLGLNDSFIRELPSGIDKLKFLETLDVRRCFIREFPSTFFKLRKLQRLFTGCAKLQEGIGNMKSLQELSHFGVEGASSSAIEELGHLTELRLLHLNFESDDEIRAKNLLEAVCNLGNHKIQSLLVACGGCRPDFMLDSWWVPPNLKTFQTRAARFTKFPTWVFLHRNLSTLSIELDRVKQEDIQKLGGSPALTEVYLVTGYDPDEPLFIGGDGFNCLTHFSLKCRGEFPKGVTFAPGAMQKLQMLELVCLLSPREEKPNGGLNLGLENLPSLRHLLLGTNSTFASSLEIEALEDAVRKATDVHPNHPTLRTGLLGVRRKRFLPGFRSYVPRPSVSEDQL